VRWIVGSGKDIAVDYSQMQARKRFIERVTKANVSEWRHMQINGQICNKYLCCASDDGINGTFITVHANAIRELCTLKQVLCGEFVVVNTCLWDKIAGKKLLYDMMCFNRAINLWFAKQELSIDTQRTFRPTTTINTIGNFGFQSSVSERNMFRNRDKGLVKAISESFIHVSPILLLSD
jgi:hypothetical protein